MSKGCPTCGRGPFFIVLDIIRPGGHFYIESTPGPDHGGLLPAPDGGTGLVNLTGTDWPVGTCIEIGRDRKWRPTNPGGTP